MPGRIGRPEPADDATILVPASEVELDDAPDHIRVEYTPGAAAESAAPVSGWRLRARVVRARVLAPVLTRLLGLLGSWTAYELRREYLSRLELQAYQHRKALARAEKAAREQEARADAKTLEVEFLTTLHTRTMARMESESLAYGAAGRAVTNRGGEE